MRTFKINLRIDAKVAYYRRGYYLKINSSYYYCNRGHDRSTQKCGTFQLYTYILQRKSIKINLKDLVTIAFSFFQRENIQNTKFR